MAGFPQIAFESAHDSVRNRFERAAMARATHGDDCAYALDAAGVGAAGRVRYAPSAMHHWPPRCRTPPIGEAATADRRSPQP